MERHWELMVPVNAQIRKVPLCNQLEGSESVCSCLLFRSACGSGDVSVVVHDSRAELQVGSSPNDLRVTMSRLKCPQAAEELREILFKMADHLSQLDSKWTLFL